VEKGGFKMCNCAEMKYKNKKGETVRVQISEKPGAYHNCEYVRKRSALVSQAENIANKEIPEVLRTGATSQQKYQWNLIFSREMGRLAKPLLA
jgi:hypothetical protein